MKDVNDYHYTITERNGSVFDTTDVKVAKLAIREGREVLKTTRRLFESGPALVRLFVTVKITITEDL